MAEDCKVNGVGASGAAKPDWLHSKSQDLSWWAERYEQDAERANWWWAKAQLGGCLKCGTSSPTRLCGTPCPACGYRYPHGDCSDA